AKRAEKNKGKSDNSDFFSPGGRPRIPGSSLRGMVRNLVEIVSYSKFQFFDDRNLYFRTFTDQSQTLKRNYTDRVIDPEIEKGVGKYKINAGYLKRRGAGFMIIPATKNKNNKQFRRYDGDKRPGPFCFDELADGNFIIRSGTKINKEHRDKDIWEIFKPDREAETIALSKQDIRNYRNDKKRNTKDLDLLGEKDSGKLTPCFYAVNEHKGEKRISIGHTAMFRIAYLNSIGDAVKPKDLHFDSEITDFAEAIFGMAKGKRQKAGRVFFEDAVLDKKPNTNPFLPIEQITLLGPNPTTVQHYLEQDAGELKHYDDDNASVRGHKLYWHKSTHDWQVNRSDFRPKITDKIRAINKGQSFTAKIRFENLHNEELGALLFVLDLPDGCCHKLGRGKSLGLGSVDVKSALYLSNRYAHYTALFAEWTAPVQSDGATYKDDFQRFILKAIGEKLKDLWQVPRLRELKTMLDYHKGTELDSKHQVSHMTITPQK
ncbi:MAG: TIGR03986 family CRISPR-associated RAMP protein, partial [bacterium]